MNRRDFLALSSATGEDKPARDGAWYGDTLPGLRDNPGCIGAHLCGAYLRNRIRNHGLRDANETPDEPAIALISTANFEAATWMNELK